MGNSQERRKNRRADLRAQRTTGKSFAYALLLVGIAVTIVFFLIKRTPTVVLSLLIILFIILIHPTLNLVPWLANAPAEKRNSRILTGIAVLSVAVVLFGVLVWPTPDVQVPALTATFNKIAIAEGLVKREGEPQEKVLSVMMLALVALHNTGNVPSAAENFRLSVELSDGTKIRRLYPEVSRNPQWTFTYEGKTAAVFEKSWLYNKAGSPLAPGSITCGWLMFTIPNVTYGQFKSAPTTWTLSFNDVMSKKYSVSRTTTGYSSPVLHFDPCAGEDFILNPTDVR